MKQHGGGVENKNSFSFVASYIAQLQMLHSCINRAVTDIVEVHT